MTLDSPDAALPFSAAVGFPAAQSSPQTAPNRARTFSIGKIAARIHRSFFQFRQQEALLRSHAEREALDPLHEFHLLEHEHRRLDGFALLMCGRSDPAEVQGDTTVLSAEPCSENRTSRIDQPAASHRGSGDRRAFQPAQSEHDRPLRLEAIASGNAAAA